MVRSCNIVNSAGQVVGNPELTQTLFLGASVTSFNCSMGWGGQSSTLTVDVIEDFQGPSCYVKGSTVPLPQFKKNSYADNHYETCVGDACFVDENGNAYNQNRVPPPIARKVPGKLFYTMNAAGGLVSKYWYDEDPGFFGNATKIDPKGTLTTVRQYKYDIIGTPVIFKMKDFIFMGLVRSWEKSTRAGSAVTYSISIESFDTLLSNSYVILDGFAGAIFAKEISATHGAPTNYVGPKLSSTTYKGTIAEGNISNVFNVYGFLESMGPDYFGGAKKNTLGLAGNDIVSALTVLTSCRDVRTLDTIEKRAFSPFGRILGKSMSLIGVGLPLTSLGSQGILKISSNFATYALGVIAPNMLEVGDSIPRNNYTLDLSELPILPDAFRLSGNGGVMSIMDIIQRIADASGVDFYTTMIPVRAVDQSFYCIIKVKTVNRTQVLPPNRVEKTIALLEKSNLNVSSSSSGKEANSFTPKVLYIGGAQQRLLQAKSYRLAYSQTTLVYEPISQRVVDFKRFPNDTKQGKVRMPSGLSTRNMILVNNVLGTSGTNRIKDPVLLVEMQDLIKAWTAQETTHNSLSATALGFDYKDTVWDDTEVNIGAPPFNPPRGNYGKTIKLPGTMVPTLPLVTRFIPIHKDIICPFFGYVQEDKFPISAVNKNIFRKMRPVWLDSWTGQIIISFDISELPTLSIGAPLSLYDPAIFPSTRTAAGATNQLGGGLGAGAPAAAAAPPTPDPQIAINAATVATESAANPAPKFIGFVITETELRAALEGFDSYFSYCLGKSIATKPDLYMMLVQSYRAAGIALGVLPGGPGITGGLGNGLQLAGPAGAANVAAAGGDAPQPAAAQSSSLVGQNWNMFINNNFIKDLQILVTFINSIAQKHYGKSYAVRVPEMSVYKDKQNADIQLPSNTAATNVSVFSGTGKLFYSYEPCDYGWEEYGNIIDDSIVVGSPKWYGLASDQGLMGTILGYNASDNIDYVRLEACLRLQRLGGSGASLLATNTRPPAAGAATTCLPVNFLIPSVDIASLDTGSFVLVNSQDAQGPYCDTKPTGTSHKIYLKASSDMDVAFENPAYLSGPRIIVTSPGLPLADSSFAYEEDPNNTVISNIALEDILLYLNLQNVGSIGELNAVEQQYILGLSKYLTPIVKNDHLILPNGAANQSANYFRLSKKQAHPLFAGIPVKSNQYCYGPWTNYPELISDKIFPIVGDPADTISHQQGLEAADNLIGGLVVETNTDWVPWQYGGSAFLDKAILLEINKVATYQGVLEQGQLTIAGPPIFGIGGEFGMEGTKRVLTSTQILINGTIYDTKIRKISYIDYKITTSTNLSYDILFADTLVLPSLGPVISNINISTSDTITTSYSFKTYSPKIGLYNKENSDRLKQYASDRLSTSLNIAQAQQNSTNQIINQRQAIMKAGKDTTQTNSSTYQSKLFGNSPTELLIGKAISYCAIGSKDTFMLELSKIDARKELAARGEIAATILKNQILPYGIDPGENKAEFDDISNSVFKAANRRSIYRSWVGMFTGDETMSELTKDYGEKSAMSMDGIFSPISFYPTKTYSTYAMSSYTNDTAKFIACSCCAGTNKIIIRTQNWLSPAQNDVGNDTEFACPCCSKAKPDVGDGINMYSLNPIVVPYGEFKNPFMQATKDRGRHSIQVVGRGNKPMEGTRSFSITQNAYPYIDPLTGKVPAVGTQTGVNQDFYEFDLASQTAFPASPNAKQSLLNHRFFGFRGPMMMHGWGYDKEGYPVPNSCDEPIETDAQNRPKRWVLGTDGKNDYTQGGKFLPEGASLLGDIIGKGHTSKGNSLVRNRTKEFYLNWASRPDLWPTGPIDLRWDYDRRVWVAGSGDGCTGNDLPPYILVTGTEKNLLSQFTNVNPGTCIYKMVYVILEEDMVKADGYDETYPVRAFLDDIEYSTRPLPNGARRLVYIKDRGGYTAPRGAKLLARYDIDTGFYEPISKPSILVFGSIIGAGQATLELSYVQGRKKGSLTPTQVVAFTNKLELNIGTDTKGLFLFENGKWILVSTS